MSIQAADSADEEARLLPSEAGRRSLYSSSINTSSPVLCELENSQHIETLVRVPVRGRPRTQYPNLQDERVRDAEALRSRMNYYSRLDRGETSSLILPAHTWLEECVVATFTAKTAPANQQSSLVTIFNIWNTMMGTSLLTMPYAIEQAGLVMGICCMVFFAFITCYTAYRVLESARLLRASGVPGMEEFTDVCYHYLGRYGRLTSIVFSLLTLVGAAAVYWVLMSTFLSNIGFYIYGITRGEFNSTTPLSNFSDVACPNPPHHHDDNLTLFTADHSNTTHHSHFEEIWGRREFVPTMLVIAIFPLLNFKDASLFARLNALGCVAACCTIGFVMYKAATWGFHAEFLDHAAPSYVPLFQWGFPVLTGISSLAFFIHNCILSIMRNQKQPEKNARDLVIAFCLVCGSYILVGCIFYLTFPLAKGCIEDNLLNNFVHSDLGAFFARIVLLLQMLSVYPLLAYIFRTQLLLFTCNDKYPSKKLVVLANVFMVGVSWAFSSYFPSIGTIIRYSGAACGLVYIFTLPSLVHVFERRAAGTLSTPRLLAHAALVLLGAANFIVQIVISIV